MTRSQQLILGVLLFNTLLQSRVTIGSDPLKRKPVESFGSDVVLKDSVLAGHYVNLNGIGIQNVRATVRKAGQDVATAVTDSQGKFHFTGLHTGVYEVVIGSRSEFIRVWDADVAPPKAKTGAQFVKDGKLQGNGGTGAALNLMGAAGSPNGVLESLFGKGTSIKEPTIFRPNRP
ncbi:SdrD B-like domain-containing protein [Planctomicrobium sp. SH668]|uniref:SdrD B-like domain-containing protein n=1 Tax=Planctomicrobium sp. SH668 TaxID=3448126 RepID=UPI003F5C3FCB